MKYLFQSLQYQSKVKRHNGSDRKVTFFKVFEELSYNHANRSSTLVFCNIDNWHWTFSKWIDCFISHGSNSFSLLCIKEHMEMNCHILKSYSVEVCLAILCFWSMAKKTVWSYDHDIAIILYFERWIVNITENKFHKDTNTSNFIREIDCQSGRQMVQSLKSYYRDINNVTC